MDLATSYLLNKAKSYVRVVFYTSVFRIDLATFFASVSAADDPVRIEQFIGQNWEKVATISRWI